MTDTLAAAGISRGLWWLLRCWFAPGLVLACAGWGGSLEGQEEEARAALRELAPPWYSAGTDGARIPDFPEDQPAVSRDRNQIAEAQPTATRTMGMPTVSFDWLSPVATLLAWWFVPGMGGGDRAPAPQSGGPEHALRLEQLPIPLDADVGDLRAAALRAAGEGDFRKAIIYLFSHALVSLDRRQLLELRRGKTNRQYLDELLRRGLTVDRFRRLMLGFERVFFGRHPAVEADFRQCLEASDALELVTLAPQTGGPA
jgi:hypothetical protein